jgi:hypothetical protein
MSKLNWNFKVNFVGNEHILVSMKKSQEDVWSEMLLGVREYAEFMQLMQEFNIAFREQIDSKLIESYYNE